MGLCALLLLACSPKENAVLRVGTAAEYPPFNYEEANQFGGVDMDLCRRIAQKLGMDVRFTKFYFNELFSALASNKIDVIASALTITDERKKTMDFSLPYYTANQDLVVRKDSNLTIDKLEDVGKHLVGSLSNTTGHIYLDEHLIDRDLMPKENLLLYPTNLDAMNALMAGKVEMVVIDDSAVLGYAKQFPIRVAFTIATREHYGLGMQKGKVLNEKINKALEQMLNDGEVQEILNRHLMKE